MAAEPWLLGRARTRPSWLLLMPNSTSLDTAFNTLTGHRPFRWQSRLFDLLVAGQPPAAVDVPTGLGKTSVMALWLIALVQRADLPRKLVYIVDRRAVVDQTTRFAADLREKLPSELAAELGVGDRGLLVSTLRGGKADDRAWLDDPSKPAIVVGTVDMVGSRLLFEGYGVSRGMRPYGGFSVAVRGLRRFAGNETVPSRLHGGGHALCPGRGTFVPTVRGSAARR